MIKNMGSIDRTTRFILALVVAALYFANIISGTLAIILGIVAVIFIATSFIGFCPIYAPFKLSTKGKES